MPEPGPSLWERAEELFHRLMDVPECERQARAREWAAGDETLYSEVMSLVGVMAGKSSEFLATPAVDVPGLVEGLGIAEGGDDPLIGQAIGEYLVKSRIGSGGMGVVYLARQENPAREVALKLMRPGVLSPSLVRRFEHEAQILGRLQHPGIAQIYGAGRVRSASGTQPYFAMEYVRGLPLLNFAAERQLDVVDRVLLAALICDAVQHAHAKGVVHRDLKPANILVAEFDDATTTVTRAGGARYQPKVLDFGVARVTEADVQLTAQTHVGEIIGTLAYMSPEQVMGRVDEVDTRTDVYALGVILYELLCGRLPIDSKGLSIAQAAPRIAHSEPAKLGSVDPRLRGDLEVIAAKALEKERARRYQSAGELAEDLRRFVVNEPILARPPTAMYQLRKFARRNRALVGGVVAAAVLLVGGIVGTSIGLIEARRSLRLAEKRELEANAAAQEAERTVDFLTSILSSANPLVARGRDLTVRELVDEAAARAGYELKGQPEVEFRTRLTLARTYLSLGASEASGKEADRALELAERLEGRGTLAYADALLDKALAEGRQSISERPLPMLKEVIEIRARLLGERSALVGRARASLAAGLVNANLLTSAKEEFEAAESILRDARDAGLVGCITAHAEFLMRLPGQGRHAEAEALLVPAIAESRAGGDRSEPDTASLLSALGSVYARAQRYAEAEGPLREAIEIRRRIYPANHPAVFTPQTRLVNVLRGLGRLKEARSEGDALAALQRKVLGVRSRDFVNVCIQVGRVCGEVGDWHAAAAYFAEAGESSKLLGDTIQTEVCLIMAADAWLSAGESAKAEPFLRQSLDMVGKSPTGIVTFASVTLKLAAVLAEREQHAERIELLRGAIQRAAAGGLIDSMHAELCGALSDALRDGKAPLAEQEAALREAFQRWKMLDSKSDEAAWSAHSLADHLAMAGRGDEAAALRAEYPTPPPKGQRRIENRHGSGRE